MPLTDAMIDFDRALVFEEADCTEIAAEVVRDAEGAAARTVRRTGVRRVRVARTPSSVPAVLPGLSFLP